jgi:hypothetical protein
MALETGVLPAVSFFETPQTQVIDLVLAVWNKGPDQPNP